MSKIELAAAAVHSNRRLDYDLSLASPEVAKILRLIRAGAFNQEFSVEYVSAELAGRALAGLAAFEEEMAVSVETYLNFFRVETGASLLTDTNLPIRQISQLVGYDDPSVFHNAFERLVKMSPGDFRRKASEARAATGVDNGELSESEIHRLSVRLAEAMFELLSSMPHADARECLAGGSIQFGRTDFFDLLSANSMAVAESDPAKSLELAELGLDSVEGSAELLGEGYEELFGAASYRLSIARDRTGAAAGEVDAHTA